MDENQRKSKLEEWLHTISNLKGIDSNLLNEFFSTSFQLNQEKTFNEGEQFLIDVLKQLNPKTQILTENKQIK